MDHIAYTILPGTAHDITQTSYKLMLLQLWRAGNGPFPIDPMTVADSLSIKDFGKIEGSTVLQRRENWQNTELKHQLAMRMMAQELTGDQGNGEQKPGVHPGGRKPSGQAPPQMASKGDGRPLTKESR
jgi:hypothetical protein